MNKSREAFRTISEVSDWLETPAHVLRFWESKFSQIRPVKGAGGRRYYRPEDMALLGGIKFLLHTQGLTIKGAQKLLREQGLRYVAALGPQPFEDEDTAPDMAQVPLHNVLAPAPMPAAAAMVAPPRHPVTTPALAAAAPDAVLPADETVTHESVANPVMTAVADVTADIVMDAPIPAPRPLSAANLAEDQDVCDSSPQTEPQILPPAAESQAIAEEISQPAATESIAVAAAPDTEAAAITADITESPADSVVQIRLTLRRPINEILVQTLMMGDRGVVLHRESLAVLAARLSDVRSRISIE